MDYRHETDVQSVTVTRNADGQIRDLAWSAPIEVRASHYVVDEEADEIEKSWEARFRYVVSDGVARVVQAKDIEGSDGHSNWQGFGYLRLLAGVEDAVANIEGVERVERAEQTLGRQLERGREAEFNPE